MKRSPTSRVFAAASLVLLLGATAHANVISTTGAVQMPTSIPADLTLGAHVSGTEISLFSEATSVLTSDPFTVDVINPGLYDQANELSPNHIGSGTFNSWLLHVGHLSGSGSPNLLGSVTFDTDVVGIMVKSTRMGGTDDLFGNPGTDYAPGASARGLELFQGDWLELSGDFRTVTVNFEIRNFIDEIRIITLQSTGPAVPGPAGIAALVGLAKIRRTRRR
jgi:hypothetical protein